MRLAIIAGHGRLPGLIHSANPDALFVTISGIDADVPNEAERLDATFEKLGRLFSDLKKAGVGRVVMAGAMSRPTLNPARFDMKMMRLAPALMAAFKGGADALLRKVLTVFEDEGFIMLGAHEAAPGLTANPGPVASPVPGQRDRDDAARGRAILDALGPVDVGQATVVAQGQCIGIETLQGTDALLDFVARTPEQKRPKGGVLVKRPKPGQDMRVDMPTIGPRTVEAVAQAGLSGIALASSTVLILDRAAVSDAVKTHGIALWAED